MPYDTGFFPQTINILFCGGGEQEFIEFLRCKIGKRHKLLILQYLRVKADHRYRSAFLRACITALIILSLVFTAGCLQTESLPPSGNDDAVAHAEMLQILSTLQGEINSRLFTMDKAVAETASELSDVGLDATCACNYVPLTTLLYADPSGKTVITVGKDGTVLSGLPATKTSTIIGKNLGNQPVIHQLFATRQALMSDVIPLEQGGYASVIEYPVFTDDDCLIGLVSLAFAPDEIIRQYAVPAVAGTPYTIMAVREDGHILYNADPKKIGKEIFAESLHGASPEKSDIARRFADEWSGYGTYTCEDTALGRIVQKEAYWITIGMHGTEWRLIIIRETGISRQ